MTTTAALPKAAPARPGGRGKAPDPIDRHVGLRVRMRRMALGLSQEKLADALGLTFQQVQKYENGINCIGASRLAHIAHALGVALPFFFDGAPPISHAGSPPISHAGAASDAAGGGQGHAQAQPEAPAQAQTPADDPTVAFAATRDGLRLITAYAAIKDAEKRKTVVWLAEIFAGALRAR